MDKKHRLLKKYIKEAENILIISHLGPDPDAFCSMLFLKEAIKQVYPEKIVKVKAKNMPSFNIPTMKDIEVVEKIEDTGEDLVILTDSPVKSRGFKEEDSLKEKDVKFFLIDHHTLDENNEYPMINEERSSASEQVYVSMKEIFGKNLKITNEMAEVVQYGIVADTYRFMYTLTTPDTMRIFADLKEISPIDLETFTYQSQKFPEGAIEHIQEFLDTVTIIGDMVYMYNEKNTPDVESASEFIVNNILRFIYGVHWGFTISKMREDKMYKISFRSTKGYETVRKFAVEMGGGGHELAAGCEVEADNIQDAIENVLKVIEELKD